jgi:phytoene/squalene synthetase
VTVSALPLARSRPLPHAPLPELLAERPIDPESALGRLFAGAPDPATESALARFVAAAPERLLGDLAPAVRLLPPLERERAAILAAWTDALLATAAEADAPERRLARLHRSALLLARALGGEPSGSPFVRAFVAESQRRSFTRLALDALIAAARARIATPRPAAREDWERRARGVAAPFVHALSGAVPTPATVDAAAALYRLLALRALPADLAVGRTQLPVADLPEPLQYRSAAEIAAAVAAECESVRPLLLRGARALAEAPLTFRRPLAFLLEAALHLLGEIDVHPEALLARPPRLGWWRAHRAAWRARREALD